MPNNALGMRALTDLSTQLKTVDRNFANAIRANLRKNVKAAGDGVLAKVKSGASWSSRIPGATSLTVRYNTKAASIRIQVNHSRAPHARPYELGNKNQYIEAALGGPHTVNGRKAAIRHSAYAKARAAGAFSRSLRHPVYGKAYTTVPTRPFFFPAISDSKGDIDQQMERVVIQTARDAGFR